MILTNFVTSVKNTPLNIPAKMIYAFVKSCSWIGLHDYEWQAGVYWGDRRPLTFSEKRLTEGIFY